MLQRFELFQRKALYKYLLLLLDGWISILSQRVTHYCVVKYIDILNLAACISSTDVTFL